MKRILFIDDEPVLLEGLRRMLRPLRTEWELEFESSSLAALTRLDTERFDVVVTDMQMPSVDGVGVLTHVMHKQPHAIRLVLTGYAQLESSMRAVPLAHQFLLKPCEPERLKAAIHRISRMQAGLRQPELRALVGGIRALPAMPAVCKELNELLARPDFTVRQVSAIAEKDAAVCAKILHIVNSAFFGLGRRVTYVHDAVSYLGTTLLKNLVTAVSLWQAMDDVPPALREEQEKIHHRSQAVAALARRMLGADRTRREEAFVAGLLHEVGQMVLIAHVPERYSEVQKLAGDRAIPVHCAERELLGVDHTQVGAYLLDAWALPYPILEAAAHHHGAEQLEHTSLELADAVYIANVLVEANEAGESGAARLGANYLARIGVAGELEHWARWATGEA